ncbi:MAG: carboxypeptidase-like regulatory domain-containing protein [Bacteroidia bacterium]
MIRLFFVFLFILLWFGPARAQQVWVLTGKVVNSETGQGIEGVVVNVKEGKQITQSTTGGNYLLRISRGETNLIEFRLLGFETQTHKVSDALNRPALSDTLRLDISLRVKPITSGTAVIYGGKVDTVFGNMKFFVEDFQFLQERIILLTFSSSLKHAQIKLVDENQKVLSTADVPAEAVELFKDFQGYVNVICKEDIYRILIRNEKVMLASLPVKQFQSEIMPCVDTLPGHILFSNYYRDYPAFSWFKYRVNDSSVHKLKSIKDKDLLEMYEEEFDFLKPVDRLAARKMELSSGVDKRIIAAHMTGFARGIHYTPLYAPLFVGHDTAYLFDHYTDRLFRFNNWGHLLDSIPISYHHPKEWKEWKHKLIQDQVNGSIYALLQRNGFYLLKFINLHDGKASPGYRLKYPYVSHIKARDGYVYYVYRPFESGQTKFLYREKIGE